MRVKLTKLMAILAIVVFFMGNCCGDTVWLDDGRKLEGRFVKEDAETVTFDAVRGGIAIRLEVPKKSVTHVERTPTTGPTTKMADPFDDDKVIEAEKAPVEPEPPPIKRH